jgi:membrane-bound lytic murein transglycosylase D
MQYKHILPLFFLTASVMPAKAQRVSAYKEVKKDTILVRPGKSLAQIAKERAADSVAKLKIRKPVPLAGQKAYYGGMNDYVMEFVRKYHRSHNRTLNVVQGKSTSPFTMMDTVLKKHEIPKELKYLAVIESALNTKAISRVGAVGPWQFMASTAKLMGLKVSKGKDERQDIVKSTNAAAKYLNVLYEDLNDWLLVVAAYNSGPTPVKRAIARTGSTNFWEIKKHLPKETQGHVLAFIATATIFENLSDFIGLNLPDDVNVGEKYVPQPADLLKPKVAAITKPLYSDEELKSMAIIRLTEPICMDFMAQHLGIDSKLLEQWNPDYELYEYKTYSSNEYKLRIPKDKLEKFIQQKEFMTKKSQVFYAEQNI